MAERMNPIDVRQELERLADILDPSRVRPDVLIWMEGQPKPEGWGNDPNPATVTIRFDRRDDPLTWDED